MARLSRYHTRQLSAVSNPLGYAQSQVYNPEHTGINTTTGNPSVSKIASRINAQNDKNIGLMSVSGNLHALYGINQI